MAASKKDLQLWQSDAMISASVDYRARSTLRGANSCQKTPSGDPGGVFDSVRLAFKPDRLICGTMSEPLHYQESLLLVALMFQRRLSRDDAAEILWPSPAHMPEEWHARIYTLVSTLRSKMKVFGWTIETDYGFGWRMERDADRDAGTETARAAA